MDFTLLFMHGKMVQELGNSCKIFGFGLNKGKRIEKSSKIKIT